MRKPVQLLALAAAAGLIVSLGGPATAAPPEGKGTDKPAQSDNLKSPKADKQVENRTKALEKVLAGKATPKGPNKVVKVAKGQYVELAREGEDSIWTVLGEFGNARSTRPTAALPARWHNQIPQPDRTVDNTTIWAPDFSQAYYENLLFSEAPGAVSMRNFYIEQSSNRYTVNGDVDRLGAGAVQRGQLRRELLRRHRLRPHLAVRPRLGQRLVQRADRRRQDAGARSTPTWRSSTSGTATTTTATATSTSRTATSTTSSPSTPARARRPAAAPRAPTPSGATAGTPSTTTSAPTGPAFNKFGGVRIGGTNFWIGDYTVEPENGGVGVFAHEFGHDLGLPDLYDTSGNTGGAENSTGFWTLYSQRLVRQHRQAGRRHRLQADPDERLREDLPRLVELPGRRLRPDRRRSSSARRRPTPSRPSSSSCCCPTRRSTPSSATRTPAATSTTPAPATTSTTRMTRSVTLPAGAVSLVRQGPLRHRAGLGLRLPDGQRHAGRHQPVDRHQPERPELRQRHHRLVRRHLGRPDRRPVGVRRPDRDPRVPLLDRRRGGRGRLRRRRHRHHRPAGRRRRDRPGLDLRRVHPHDRARSRSRSSTPTSPSTATTAATTTALRTGPYNFGFLEQPEPAELGRALPVPGRPAGLVLRHLVRRQQRRRQLRVAVAAAGCSCRSTRTRTCCSGRTTARSGGRGSSRTTRPSGWSRPTRSACTPTASQQCYGGLPANPLFDDTQSYWVAPEPGHRQLRLGQRAAARPPARRSASTASRRRAASCRCSVNK